MKATIVGAVCGILLVIAYALGRASVKGQNPSYPIVSTIVTNISGKTVLVMEIESCGTLYTFATNVGKLN